MSIDSADAFLDYLASNEELMQEFQSVTDPVQATAILEREGVTCSPEEIREAFLERFGAELNEEQLSAIAGGIDAATIGAAAGLGGGIMIGVGIAVASSAAAAA